MSDMSPGARHPGRPAFGDMQGGNGDPFATIEADQGRIHQFTHLHHLRKDVDVDAGAFPDLRASRCR